jgi:flagellar biosynthesis protein FlhF
MKLETYTGPSVPELLARVRAEMGSDAVLLSVRRADRNRFEVVATDSAPGAAGFESEPVRDKPSARRTGRPLILALVGPTGAGKTTTLAKLAAHDAAFGGTKVGFITLDTYRVGAAEQLEIHARLARIPMETIYEVGEIPRALRRLRDREVILVDTPGRGPREDEDAAAVRSCLRALEPDEVHFALPAGLDAALAWRLVARSRQDGVTHVLPTKLDEAPEADKVFAVADRCRLPVRWIADGQRIPGDLRRAPARRGMGAAERRDGFAAVSA